MKNFLLTLIGVLLALPSFARDITYEYEGQTLKYNVYDNDNRAFVAEYNKVSGDLIIPSVIKDEATGTEYSVYYISRHAFSGCTKLTSVSIPESVRNIGVAAFYQCTALTKAEFASIESLCSIEFGSDYSNPLYFAHTLYIDGTEITEIEIPATVETIGYLTFDGCSEVTSITIPESVQSIGTYAFRRCTGLTELSLPESLQTIRERAFWDCDNLNKVEFASIESLCSIEFEDISSNPLYFAHTLYIDGTEITELKIPDTVENIGNYSFVDCTGLTSISFPESLQSIGMNAFSGCSGITEIVFPESIQTISGGAFRYCSGLNKVTSLSMTPPILRGSFDEDTFSSARLELPAAAIADYIPTDWGRFSNIYPIGSEKALVSYSDGGLNYRLVPAVNSDENNFAVIESGSYRGDITIPEYVEYTDETGKATHYYVEGISYKALSSSSISSISFNSHIKFIGNYAFMYCKFTEIALPESLKSIGSYAFEQCSALTEVTIPESVKSLGSGAFSGCEALTKATIGNNVQSIGGRTFANCINLTEVTLGNSVRSIGSEAFRYCTSLQKVKFSKSLESIGYWAFYGCANLTEVSLPESLKSIEIWAFDECSGLTKAEFASIESLCSIEFEGPIANPLTYAHHLYIDGAEVTEVVIPSTVKSIGNYAFSGGSELTEVNIPASVKSIGVDPFSNCNKLKKVEFASIESICSIQFASHAFWHVPQLYINGKEVTKIRIPSSVTSIGDFAFSDFTGITSVVISNSVTEIGKSAFLRCSGLSELTIGNSVESIGNGAFSDCSNLAAIYNSAEIPVEADNYVFATKIYGTATLYVPESSVEAYQQTNPWSQFANIEGYDFSGIEDIDADTKESGIDYTQPYEVFNICGIRVASTTEDLAPGLYIIRQGKTAKKIIVK